MPHAVLQNPVIKLQAQKEGGEKNLTHMLYNQHHYTSEKSANPDFIAALALHDTSSRPAGLVQYTAFVPSDIQGTHSFNLFILHAC